MRYSLFLFACCLSVGQYQTLLLAEEPICLDEGALPGFFAASPEQTKAVLIPKLKGILLVGHAKQLLRRATLNTDSEIDWIGLDIPGNPNQLQKKLSPFLHKPVSKE